ncbi:MAG: MraY family glycosyltransferase [Patescibacteria group bacterium]|nr:MraY family glycosyltransferase [Patescibacteria group bacterium]
MNQILPAIAAFAAAVAVTPLVRRFARQRGIFGYPGGRRQHEKPTPLWGGVAIFAALAVGLGVAWVAGALPGSHIPAKHVWGIVIAAALLVTGGALDDRFDFRPCQQIIWPLLAVIAVIVSGIGIDFVTNPFGGQLYLDRWQWTVLWWDGLPYKLTFVADVFTVVWLMTMTYTTKFLDGLDGLVAGVAVIGAVVVACVSALQDVTQPDTATLALVVAGAFAGFLIFNFSPASIFLGEGGSTLAGFLLGTLAIISGGKIATTLLVLGLPLFDAVLVVLRRVLLLHRSPFVGDRTHLHFRLQDLGLTPRQTVLFYYLCAAAFGTSTLVLSGQQKLAAIGLVVSLIVIILAAALGRRRQPPFVATGEAGRGNIKGTDQNSVGPGLNK